MSPISMCGITPSAFIRTSGCDGNIPRRSEWSSDQGNHESLIKLWKLRSTRSRVVVGGRGQWSVVGGQWWAISEGADPFLEAGSFDIYQARVMECMSQHRYALSS